MSNTEIATISIDKTIPITLKLDLRAPTQFTIPSNRFKFIEFPINFIQESNNLLYSLHIDLDIWRCGLEASNFGTTKEQRFYIVLFNFSHEKVTIGKNTYLGAIKIIHSSKPGFNLIYSPA